MLRFKHFFIKIKCQVKVSNEILILILIKLIMKEYIDKSLSFYEWFQFQLSSFIAH